MARTDRMTPVLIALLFASPMLAAWIAQQAWHPGLTNYGELVTSGAPEFGPLSDVDGHPANLARMHGRWLLATVVAGDCKTVCRDNLYLARQATVAQGRDASRIERLLVLGQGDAIPTEPGLHVMRAPPERLRDLAGAAGVRTYVIDPAGRTVLRFPEQPDGRGMIHDLKRLLQASSIG